MSIYYTPDTALGTSDELIHLIFKPTLLLFPVAVKEAEPWRGKIPITQLVSGLVIHTTSGQLEI